MRLLCDSDALCKLAAIGLLEAALEIIGSTRQECLRLPALPHMLRRGRKLREMLGEEHCQRILPVVEAMTAAPQATDEWKTRLVEVPDIDPGEAQLLAVAAEQQLVLVTGDKRALQAVSGIPEYPPALRGKIVLFEIVLLELCKKLGNELVGSAVRQSGLQDAMLRVAFSEGNPTPREALQGYIEEARNRVAPLELWEPAAGGQPG